MHRSTLCLVALALAPGLAAQVPTLLFDAGPGVAGTVLEFNKRLANQWIFRANYTTVDIAFSPENAPGAGILGVTDGRPAGTALLNLPQPLFGARELFETVSFWGGLGQTPMGERLFFIDAGTRSLRLVNLGFGSTFDLKPLSRDRAFGSAVVAPMPPRPFVCDGRTGQVTFLQGSPFDIGAVQVGNSIVGATFTGPNGQEAAIGNLGTGQVFNLDTVSGPGSAWVRNFAVLDHDRVACSAADATGDMEMLVIRLSDRTFVRINLNPTASSDPANVTAMGPGEVLFTATTPQFGREFWQTDGTAAGTIRLTDLNPGPADAIQFDPANQDAFPVANGHAVFPATAPATGSEAYTKAFRITNVRLAADHTPGPNGSDPIQFGTHGGKFQWVSGNDLAVWQPGDGSDRILASGMDRTRAEHRGVGDRVIFSYSTPATGHELHAASLGAVAVPFGEGSDADFQFNLEATPPVLGRNFTLRGTTPTDGGVSLKLLGIAMHNWIPAGAGNRLYLDPTGPLVSLGVAPVTGRTGEYSTFIGPDPALVGVQAAVQAIHITPTLGVNFSNPVWLMLGTR